ncbi:MAG: hypothetical protein NXI31_12690 [bacterium]|nr:hypothetical protein [bacterium]
MIGPRDALVVSLGAVVLFLFYGAAQMLPWGAGSARNFSSTSEDAYVAASGPLTEEPEGTWVTPAFERDFVDGVNTLATDHTFSWIFAVPRQSYDLGRYFGLHAITQAAVALMLFVALRLLAPLPRSRRLLTVGILAMAAAAASYGAMMNWLGMSLRHGVGESLNLVLSWLLAGSLMDRLRHRRNTPPG